MDPLDDFPPFDFTLRPNCDDRGGQLAPETFVRWLSPACWEDSDGGIHFDIPLLHRWLGLPPGAVSVEETTEMMGKLLRELYEAEGEPPAKVIVRP